MKRCVKTVNVCAEGKHECMVSVEESTEAIRELQTILIRYGGNQIEDKFFFDNQQGYNEALAELIFRGAWIKKCS